MLGAQARRHTMRPAVLWLHLCVLNHRWLLLLLLLLFLHDDRGGDRSGDHRSSGASDRQAKERGDALGPILHVGAGAGDLLVLGGGGEHPAARGGGQSHDLAVELDAANLLELDDALGHLGHAAHHLLKVLHLQVLVVEDKEAAVGTAMLLRHLEEPSALQRPGCSKHVVARLRDLGGAPWLGLRVDVEGHVNAVLGRVERQIVVGVDRADAVLQCAIRLSQLGVLGLSDEVLVLAQHLHKELDAALLNLLAVLEGGSHLTAVGIGEASTGANLILVDRLGLGKLRLGLVQLGLELADVLVRGGGGVLLGLADAVLQLVGLGGKRVVIVLLLGLLVAGLLIGLAGLLKVAGHLLGHLVAAQEPRVVLLLPLHQRVLHLSAQHRLQLLQHGRAALGLGQKRTPSVVQRALLEGGSLLQTRVPAVRPFQKILGVLLLQLRTLLNHLGKLIQASNTILNALHYALVATLGPKILGLLESALGACPRGGGGRRSCCGLRCLWRRHFLQ
eukprot:m.59302 g.59302  ORF g.59302 m.59302 type:complete len:504 (-) comp12225_c1_seq1:32-1543(-)